MPTISLNKRVHSMALALLFCILSVGCTGFAKEKKENSFGMDVNQLNPLVMYATDNETGKTVFSRDPSIISSVTTLFESMQRRETGDSNGKGISFRMSTMYGDFLFGECWDDRMRLNGQEYTLDKDNEETIRLLYGRLVSETEHTGSVDRETILAVRPDMTYRELLDSFGPTMETAVVGIERAYLYQYDGRPFYILFKRDTDTVGMCGKQLLEEIAGNYNLSQSLTEPLPLDGGRLAVYEQAFDHLLDKTEKPGILWIDTERLVHIDQEERTALTEHLKTRATQVNDERKTSLYTSGGEPLESAGEAALWIGEYSYIGEKKMVFTVFLLRLDETLLSETFTFSCKDGDWKME